MGLVTSETLTSSEAGEPAGVPQFPELELRNVANALARLSSRLDAVAGDPAFGDGLAAMGVDQASQAVHLALVELRDLLVRSSGDESPPVDAALAQS